MSVQGRKLAESLPYTRAYVEESMKDFAALVSQDEPHFSVGGDTKNQSWISFQTPMPPYGHLPFHTGPTYR